MRVERRVWRWGALGFAIGCVVIGAVLSALSLHDMWAVDERGLTRSAGKEPTHDFTNLWIGGRLALAGRLDALFDVEAYRRAIDEMVRPFLAGSEWSYPPTMLLLGVPFALLALYPAFALWSAGTLVMFLAAARACGAGLAILSAMALSPAAVNNFLFGQNGAFTAACLVGGYALAPRRPVLAGALIGLLVVKPHAALLAPICLAAAGAWRAFFVAGLCALALAAASLAFFGVEAWRGFFSVTTPMMVAYMEAPPLHPYQRNGVSTFLLARTLGADVSLAYALQGAATAAAAVMAWRLWRAPCADPALRAAASALLGVVAAPYGYAYELFALTFAAILLVARDGARSPALLVLFGVAWVWPLLSLFSTALFYPITPLVAAAVLFACWRALRAQ
ncbi:MAG: glycosyltransferase family 87 protein [Beijerinckiaceae bacterium]